MKLFAILLGVLALAYCSTEGSQGDNYFTQKPVEITFPPQPPPLALFACNDTITAGCGIATSCESMDDACNRAQKSALVGVVKQCAQLKTGGGKLCVPDPGFDFSRNVLPPLCNKIRQYKDHVYYCTDMRAYQCTSWCSSHCFEHDATMIFLA